MAISLNEDWPAAIVDSAASLFPMDMGDEMFCYNITEYIFERPRPMDPLHPHPSPFVWGLARRLSLVAAANLVLWLAVGWALDWWK